MIHISLSESKLPTGIGGELSRDRLAFNGNVFLFRQLRLCFLLRNLQRQDTVLQFGFDILFRERLAHIEAAAHAAGIALLSDELAGLFVLLILVKALCRRDVQVPVLQAELNLILVEARKFDIRDIVRQSAWVLVSAVVSLIFGLMLAFSPVLQMSVGVFVILLTGWWILALGIIRIVHAFHLLKIKRESDGFGFGEMLGSNWWIALILGALLTLFGVIVILNPMLGLGVIGVLIGCGVITAGVNLIYLGCSPWIL